MLITTMTPIIWHHCLISRHVTIHYILWLFYQTFISKFVILRKLLIITCVKICGISKKLPLLMLSETSWLWLSYIVSQNIHAVFGVRYPVKISMYTFISVSCTFSPWFFWDVYLIDISANSCIKRLVKDNFKTFSRWHELFQIVIHLHFLFRYRWLRGFCSSSSVSFFFFTLNLHLFYSHYYCLVCPYQLLLPLIMKPIELWQGSSGIQYFHHSNSHLFQPHLLEEKWLFLLHLCLVLILGTGISVLALVPFVPNKWQAL